MATTTTKQIPILRIVPVALVALVVLRKQISPQTVPVALGVLVVLRKQITVPQTVPVALVVLDRQRKQATVAVLKRVPVVRAVAALAKNNLGRG